MTNASEETAGMRFSKRGHFGILNPLLLFFLAGCFPGCSRTSAPPAEKPAHTHMPPSVKVAHQGGGTSAKGVRGTARGADTPPEEGVKGAKILSRLKKRPPQRWAVLIGVTQYQHLPKLKFCARDMIELADVLVVHGGYKKGHVRLLVDADANGEKTKAGPQIFLPLRGRIQAELKAVIEKLGREDTLLLAFSGHGMQKNGKGFLMPSDADPGRLEKTAVAMSWIYHLLDHCPAKSKIVIVDACHSGAAKGISASHTSFIGGKGVYGLFSCEVNQQSYEDPALKHGVFTYYLIAALRGEADLVQNKGNGDKQVSADEVFQFVSLKVARHTKERLGRDQRPFRRVSASGTHILSKYDEPPLPENTALLTLPGLTGNWWFTEMPWLLPFLRGRLSEQLDASLLDADGATTAGQTVEQRMKILFSADIAAVTAQIREVFQQNLKSAEYPSSTKNLLLQLADWNNASSPPADPVQALKFRTELLQGVARLGDAHTLAVFQHHFGLPEAGQTYAKAIEQFEADANRSPGRYALCLADYGRWLAGVHQHRKACAQFQLARSAVPNSQITALFQIDCWCHEANSRRRLGEWDKAENCLQQAHQLAAEHLPAEHPFRAHIHRRFAWMYMDQWRLAEARTHFEEANRLGAKRAKSDLTARIYVYHNNHGIAMSFRYAGRNDEAAARYQKLQRDIYNDLKTARGEERTALTDRLVNTMERLGDCYLFTARPQPRLAATIYRQAYRLGQSLSPALREMTRVRLTYKRILALSLQKEPAAEIATELQQLDNNTLADSQKKALALYGSIARALQDLQKTKSPRALRELLVRFVADQQQKSFSRDEFDLLLLCSREILRHQEPNSDTGTIAADVERLFELIPDRFRRPEVLPYQRPFYDFALQVWLKKVAPQRMVDAVSYISIAKTGRPVGLVPFSTVVYFYFPADEASTGYAVVFSPQGDHAVHPLSFDIGRLRKTIETKKTPPALPPAVAALLKNDAMPVEIHWDDVVLQLKADQFPFEKSSKGSFVESTKSPPVTTPP